MQLLPDRAILRHPLTRRIGWVGYAILFYVCGESFNLWLLEPAQFAGGLRWLGVGLFVPVLIGFFVLQRYWGCDAGRCRVDSENPASPAPRRQEHYSPPPGC